MAQFTPNMESQDFLLPHIWLCAEVSTDGTHPEPVR